MDSISNYLFLERYSDEVWEIKKEEEDVKLEIQQVGEECARRAGSIINTQRDGYYNSQKCVADFEKVT